VSISIESQQFPIFQDVPNRSYVVDGQGIVHGTRHNRKTLKSVVHSKAWSLAALNDDHLAANGDIIRIALTYPPPSTLPLVQVCVQGLANLSMSLEIAIIQ
jgi:hypothetical protein